MYVLKSTILASNLMCSDQPNWVLTQNPFFDPNLLRDDKILDFAWCPMFLIFYNVSDTQIIEYRIVFPVVILWTDICIECHFGIHTSTNM